MGFDLSYIAKSFLNKQRGLMHGRLVPRKCPYFSIVVPLYNSDLKHLQEMINSVESQVYGNWELILVNGSPERDDLRTFLSSLTNEKIKVVELEDNEGISENTNAGIEIATGDFVALLDHDDLLDEEALYSYAMLISEDETIDAIYSDQDFIDENGHFVVPLVKPCLSIDFLRCQNYISHFLAVKTTLAKALLMRSEFDGAQDYDFVLRLWEQTKNIKHVSKVLYHWRITENSTSNDISAKDYALDAGFRAIKEHLHRCNLEAEVTQMERFPCSHVVKYKVTGNPLVSIVIPHTGDVKTLNQCVTSIFEKTDYDNFEIVVFHNGALEENNEYFEQLQHEHPNIKVFSCEGGFSTSEITNFGVENSNGEFVLLLSDLIEAIEPKWLEFMLGHFQRDDVGVVGAKLLYPNDTVQHAGLSLDLNNIGKPFYMFAHTGKDEGGYMDRACKQLDILAVTGACLLTSKKIYSSLGGMDKNLTNDYKDIDFCLQVNKSGKLVIFEPNAILYNHCQDDIPSNDDKNTLSHDKFVKKWREQCIKGDPFSDVKFF